MSKPASRFASNPETPYLSHLEAVWLPVAELLAVVGIGTGLGTYRAHSENRMWVQQAPQCKARAFAPEIIPKAYRL